MAFANMKQVGKKFIDSRLLLFLGLFFLYSGCTSRSGHLVGEGGGPYNMTLSTGGAEWVAGSPIDMTFKLVDSRTGESINTLQTAHERLMHIFITDESLEYFAHVHILGEAGDEEIVGGKYLARHTFNRSGLYRLVVEFVHFNRIWHKSFSLSVTTLSDDPKDIDLGILNTSGYQLRLDSPDKIYPGEEVELSLSIEREGLPVSNLQTFLGSELHGAVWRDDLRDFGHLHSFTPKMENLLNQISSREGNSRISPSQLQAALVELMCGESELVFPGPLVPLRYTFPNEGIYHLFLQVAPLGIPITEKFILKVGR